MADLRGGRVWSHKCAKCYVGQAVSTTERIDAFLLDGATPSPAMIDHRRLVGAAGLDGIGTTDRKSGFSRSGPGNASTPAACSGLFFF